MTLLHDDSGTGWSSPSSTGDFAPMVQKMETWHTLQLTYYPCQDPGLELVNPKIYIICKRLVLMKGPFLVVQRCRICVTKSNNRLTRRRPGEDSRFISLVSDAWDLKPDHWLIAMTASKDVWTEWYTVWHMDILQIPWWDIFYAFGFLFCVVCFVLDLGGKVAQAKDRYKRMGRKVRLGCII